MFSLVALPDIHAALHHMRHLTKAFEEADLVILAGDMTIGQRYDLEQLLAIIRQSNPNILAVCGNHDRNKMDRYLEDEGISLHGTHRIIKGLAFLGCGGSLPNVGGHVFTEAQYAEILKQSIIGLDPAIPKVLVAHHPPYQTMLDLTHRKQHVGSKSIRAFIEATQPILCITGHIHEAFGMDQIGVSKLINSGPIMGTNRYTYAEIEDGKVKTLELRKANQHGS